MKISTRISIASTALITAMATSFPALSATVWVEKWGGDTDTCGSRNAPCETIQYAIDHRSVAGTRVVVGSGIYHEAVEIGHNADGEPLTKLKLESSKGIRTTLIQHHFENTPGINISANDVRVGRRNRGFTVRTPNNSMGIATAPGGLQDGITIEGNRLTHNSYGIFIHGENTTIRHNIAEHINATGIFCSSCFDSVIKENISRDNGWGFVIESHDNLVFSRNVAAYNAHIGYHIVAGGPIEFRDNVAEFNEEAGFYFQGTPTTTELIRNIAFANNSHGFEMAGFGPGNRKVLHNAAFGNLAAGFHFDGLVDINMKGNSLNGNLIGINLTPGSSVETFSHNNTLASTSGCGIQNQSGAALTYSAHYFGSTDGPDPIFDADSHDSVCGADDVNGSYKINPNKFKANAAAKL